MPRDAAARVCKDKLPEFDRSRWSLRWYEEFFSTYKWMEGLWNSLIVGGITIVFALIVGMTAALAFSRYRFK